MSDELTILSLADRDRWTAEHDDCGLPSQSWRYAWGLSASGVAPKLAIVRSRGARMLLPFVEREWRGTTDIATIMGISGASIMPASAAPLALWREFAAAQGWVAGYIQLAASLDLAADEVRGRLVTNNMTLLLDLRDEPSQQSFSRTIRRKIRAGEDAGAVVSDDRQALSGILQRLYPQTMQRVGAAAQFDYSPATLERWALDPASELVGAAVGGTIEAVYLFLVAGTHAESHILGCTDRGRDLVAWLIWQGIQRLRARDVTTLNLTGGMRPGDGIYRFKQGFGAIETPRRAVHQIYDRQQYDELCCQAGAGPDEAWFPAYRAPALHA